VFSFGLQTVLSRKGRGNNSNDKKENSILNTPSGKPDTPFQPKGE
jgi:hypothetical protein